MQYVLIIYHGTSPLPGTPEWDALPETERQAIYADYAELNTLDTLTPCPPLGLPKKATTVRVENGATVTSEGPYVGLTRAVGGVAVLEADDLDAAVAVAARVPQARNGGAVEVRPSERYW